MTVKTQLRTDKIAVAISTACVLHCFFVPSFIIATSGFLTLSIDNELIHQLILFFAVPVSVFALYLGYKNHKTFSFLPYAFLGLGLLILAVILGEEVIGEIGEQGVTLLGSMFVVFAHYKNHQTCKEIDCSCHDN
tara:strand:+ start:483 stop:887 length:405 start_codon:yes stop_codon:yes gene_type:complete